MPDQPRAGTAWVKLRRREPEGYTAYQVPDDLSLPEGWDEYQSVSGFGLEVGTGCIQVFDGCEFYIRAEPGEWIVIAGDGRAEVWSTADMTELFERTDPPGSAASEEMS